MNSFDPHSSYTPAGPPSYQPQSHMGAPVPPQSPVQGGYSVPPQPPVYGQPMPGYTMPGYSMPGYAPYQNGIPVGYDPRPERERQAKIRRLRQTINRGSWAVFAGIVAMNVLFLLFMMLLPAFGYRYTGGQNGFGGLSPLMYYLIECVAYIVGIGLPFILMMKHCDPPAEGLLRFERVSPGGAVCCILFGIGACMAANYPANVVSIFLESIGLNGTVDSGVPSTPDISANIFYVIGIAVIPPLVEELGFRGVILGSLRKYGDTFAVVVSALIFGIFHGNLVQIPFAFCVGLALGYVMVRTNNLMLCVIIHALNNGISVLFELVEPYIPEQTYEILNVVLFYGLMLLGVVAVVILLTRYKKQFGSRRDFVSTPWGPRVLYTPPQVELSRQDRFSAVLGNPGFLSLLGLSLLECIEFLYL